MLLLLLSKTFRRLVGLVLLAVLVVLGGTAARVWWVARQDHRPHSDAIVVLGASQADGRPGRLLAARLDHALALYRAGVAPRIVTVGGSAPGDRFTEAEAGARYLAARGVTDVVVVGQGRDTLVSLQAADAQFRAHGWHTAVLVTDPWHEERSARMAGDLGLSVSTSPTRTGPSVASRSVELRYVARETAGYLYYRVAHLL